MHARRHNLQRNNPQASTSAGCKLANQQQRKPFACVLLLGTGRRRRGGRRELGKHEEERALTVSLEIQKYKDLRGDGLSPHLLQLWGKLLFLATCQQKIGTLPKVRQKNSPYRSRLMHIARNAPCYAYTKLTRLRSSTESPF